MEQKAFTIGEPWRFVIHSIRHNVAYLIMVALILLLPLDIIYYLERVYIDRQSGLSDLANIVSFLLLVMVYAAFIKIGLRFAAGEKATLSDLSEAFLYYWRYLLGLIIYMLIFLGGMILLIVPGIIWAVKYQFFGFFIIDKGMKPMEAITRSGQLTTGSKGRIFIFDLIFMIIESSIVWSLWLFSKTASQILGSLLFSLFIIALAHIYRKLLGFRVERSG